MTPALPPENESARLAALEAFDVLDTPPDAALDDITLLASAICGTPIALVSLVDGTRQWFKSKVGIDVKEGAREEAFCAHTIRGSEIFVVEDAAKDSRFDGNPFVAAGVRFYAGAPLITENGLALGSLCVIDRVPRQLTDVQSQALRVLAKQVMTHLRLKSARTDRQNTAEELRLANQRLKDSNEQLESRVSARTAELESAMTALRNEEAGFRFLADAMPQMVWTARPDGNLDYYNQRWFDYTGLTFDQTKDWGWKAVQHPDDLDACVAGWVRSIVECVPFDGQMRFKRGSDGEYRWHLGRAIPMRDAAGNVIRWVGTCTDIHDQKTDNVALIEARNQLEHRVAERTDELTRGNQFFEAVLDNISDCIVACDETARPTVFNRAARELHGIREEAYPLEQWAEKYSLLRPDGKTPLQAREVPLFRAFQGESLSDVEMVVANRATGSKRRLRVSGRAILDDSGKKLGAVVGMHDITDRAAAEEKFRVLFEFSSEPHMLVQGNRIVDINNAAMRLLGCTDKTRVLDMHPADFSPEFQPDGRRSGEKRFEHEEAVRKNGFHRFEWTHRKFDGVTFPAEISLTKVQLDGTEAMLAVWHDLTEQKRAEEWLQASNEELKIARDAAEAATRSKSEFLANMSHEIRTPMTAILGYTDLLEEPQLAPRAIREHVQTVRRHGQHLIQILNDVLDISKIEAGKLKVEKISCSLPHIIADVESLMRSRAIDKGIAFGVEYRSHLPGAVVTDPTRLRQILLNLVGNAVKFTEAGGVRLAVGVEKLLSGVRLRIDVIDTGIGLTTEQVGRLFQPFDQADGSVSRRFGGTGLGLAICKRLAEMLGGEISVISESGKGSTFSVVMPITVDTETAPMALGELAASPQAELVKFPNAQRVLVVDDGVDNRRLASIYLESAGLVVESTINGQKAVEMVNDAVAAGRPFDAVLMDMQMPVMDGYTAAAQLRRQGHISLPIIAFTAHAMAGEREQCFTAGCNDYVSKPINRRDLLAAFDRAFNRGTAAHTVAPSTTMNPTPPAAPSVVSDLAEDPFIRKILSEYVGGLPSQVRLLTDALRTADIDQLRTTVHQLKGTGGSYGFPDITTLAATAEASIDAQLAMERIDRETQELIGLLRRVAGYERRREVGATVPV